MNIKQWNLTVLLPVLPVLLLLGAGIFFLCTDNLPFSDFILNSKNKEVMAKFEATESLEMNNFILAEELAYLDEIYNGAMHLPDKEAENLFREQVSGMQMINIGQVRSSKITEGVTLYEITFSAGGTVAEMDAFLNKMAEGYPGTYWRSISIKPEPGTSQENVTLSGTLTAFNITLDPFMIKEDGGGE